MVKPQVVLVARENDVNFESKLPSIYNLHTSKDVRLFDEDGNSTTTDLVLEFTPKIMIASRDSMVIVHIDFDLDYPITFRSRISDPHLAIEVRITPVDSNRENILRNVLKGKLVLDPGRGIYLPAGSRIGVASFYNVVTKDDIAIIRNDIAYEEFPNLQVEEYLS